MSPRISFSYNVSQTDENPNSHGSDSSLFESTSDFDFGSNGRCQQQSSSADELFANGKIIPLQIKNQSVHANSNTALPKPNSPLLPLRNQTKERSKEITVSLDKDAKMGSKFFCSFTRSSSINTRNDYKPGIIWSLPLFSRSNSCTKENYRFLQKSLSTSNAKSSSSSSLHNPPSMRNEDRGRTHKRSYRNGVRISAVVNVPIAYISTAAIGFFGLGNFFCNGKDKSKNNKSFPTPPS